MITAHEEYLRLGLNGQERQRHYRELLQAQIEPHLLEEIRSSTNGNYALGNKRFREEIAQMLDRRVTPGKAGRPVKEY